MVREALAANTLVRTAVSGDTDIDLHAITECDISKRMDAVGAGTRTARAA